MIISKLPGINKSILIVIRHVLVIVNAVIYKYLILIKTKQENNLSILQIGLLVFERL